MGFERAPDAGKSFVPGQNQATLPPSTGYSFMHNASGMPLFSA
jgi:hypothetical protein